MTDKPSYPEIDEFIAAIKQHNIHFYEEVKDEDLSPIEYRRLLVIINQNKFSVPVCDDYNDVDQMNPVVLFQLLLREMEYYEEAEDYLVWCKDLGFDAASELCRSVYFELRECVPKMRELLGKSLVAISDFDFEMNTGVTIALRQAKL